MKQTLLRLSIAFVTVTVPVTAILGCGKASPQATAEVADSDTAVTEKHDAARVSWDVAPDGQVIVQLRDDAGQPISKGVSGTLRLEAAPGAPAPAPIPLLLHAETGTYRARIPKLDADLTALGYELFVNGAPVQGTLHVPRGGTKELVESAREAASAKKLPDAAKGPNGGVVQVVGDDIVEVVADKDSGAVRMYVLDDDLKPLPVGKRKGKLAFAGAGSEIIDLDPDPSGAYLAGKAVVKIQPVKLTIVVIDGEEIDVALCHYAPGAVIVVGAAAPPLVVFVVTGWPVVVIQTPVIVQPVLVKKGKGKGKFKVKGW